MSISVAQAQPTVSTQPATSVDSPAFWLEREYAVAQRFPISSRANAFAQVALQYAKAGDVARFHETMKKFKELESSIPDAKERAGTYCFIVAGFALVGDENEFEAGLREVSGAYTDPDSLPDIIASILAFTGRLDQAAKLARHATRADSRSHQLIFVATAMARLGKKQDYELTMQAAEKETADAIAAFPDDKENDLLSLAGAQVRSGDFDRAEELADRLSAADGASIHASVARKSALRSDQARYKKAMDRAIEMASTVQSEVKAQRAYESIADALAVAKDETRLGRIMNDNKNAKGLVDVDFLFERARISAEDGDVSSARSLVQKALAATQSDDDSIKELHEGQLKQLYVVEALVHAGKDEAAMQMGIEIQSQPQDALAVGKYVYESIAMAQAKRGRLAAARATIERVPESATAAGMPAREYYATQVAKAAAESGQPLESVAAWIDSLKNPRARMNGYWDIADAIINRSHGYLQPVDTSD